jgi:hypothetical protein
MGSADLSGHELRRSDDVLAVERSRDYAIDSMLDGSDVALPSGHDQAFARAAAARAG